MLTLLVLYMLSLCTVRPVVAAPGDLDPSFGAGGTVTTAFLGSDIAQALVVQADGKLVAAGKGRGRGFLLTRYTPDGSLDPSFGTGGRVTTDFEPTGFNDFNIAYALVVQADGKLVAAGGGEREFALVRYTPDGSLDLSFGTGGKVTTDFGGLLTQAYALVVQADGKLVAAGGGHGAKFNLARYTPDGSLDPSFGTGGKVTTDFNDVDIATALAVQADGKLVAAGLTGAKFALARYTPDGSLDPSFGTGGKVTTDFGSLDEASALVVQADSKLVAAGRTGAKFALARYTPDGSLDPSFGTGGRVTTDFGTSLDQSNALVVQADGKLVAAGRTDANFALARYFLDGSLDPSFGTGGKVTTDFGGGPQEARALVVQADGKLVAAGFVGGRFALARYISSDTVTSKGVIIVNNDEWTLSDEGGFTHTPDDARQFALNAASYFTGGTQGSFLVYSAKFPQNSGLVGDQLKNTMEVIGGHKWKKIEETTDFTLEDLLQYDGIFLTGVSTVHPDYPAPPKPHPQVLIDYLRAGKNIYLAGGSASGHPQKEADLWNPLLSKCGLTFEPVHNDIDQIVPINSGHPLFNGVQNLLQKNGNSINKLNPSNPNAAILVKYQGEGLYAICSFDKLELVNNRFSGTPDRSTFTFDPTQVPDGPGGTFTFSVDFCNTEPMGGAILTELRSVTQQTSGSFVAFLNRDSGPPGKGSVILFPKTGGYADALLMPGECVRVDYEIGLLQRSSFRFFVDIFGMEQ
ncbi:MAG: hypothetical protein D8M57_04865 [Candidatus Scalindua sp. AMX11]|nr:MAG: hypothetical protein DWQ00_03730 [Candidatus Scalindua sp.]NOG84555.1 hypothetical protein [Planctomycetota bacterium]RZV92330.1 MAG: hypothetical protein EX341_04590 [Candidatus Scalindua sp. SCAELEC01]TDE66146.1 MAG: hypothetical protein D8M57_04865 [Candidatus Scalindua sp. AMX11]GJQ59120.1 MAG: hypothetical protein SCALA701_19210 [Candidatus Scalindua sp.]